MLNRWLLLRFDVLGACANLLTTLFTVWSASTWAAVAISSAMALTQSIYWTCRFVTQMELDLNAVERVAEYLAIAQEPRGARAPAAWPVALGRQRCRAQRRLPSMMMATWRGTPRCPAPLRSSACQCDDSGDSGFDEESVVIQCPIDMAAGGLQCIKTSRSASGRPAARILIDQPKPRVLSRIY